MRTLIIKTGGHTEEHEGEVTLEFMQGVVGGTFERYQDPEDGRDLHFWVNEDGIALGLTTNLVASIAAGTQLRGDVLVTGMNRMGTDIAGLPDEYFREITYLKLLIIEGHLPSLDDLPAEMRGGESS